jgi:hypothetical protein
MLNGLSVLFCVWLELPLAPVLSELDEPASEWW